ncbi:putative Metal dependent phosphohydrolase [uncultured delta proteobacterium]|uniref:Putative Metal dependent phosphohydrolase n=1 Tax=uncultured delta proteobacterium TaxID=34034 RepID=A0A212J9Q0_9DELT|nr:putative Metal dependent phosphohydrolase [uncultured delta proteobacterium]
MDAGRVNNGGKRRFALSSFLGLNGYFGLLAGALLLLAGALLAGLGYVMMTQMLEAAVERRVDIIGRDIKRVIVSETRRPAEIFLASAAKSQLAMARTREERAGLLPLVLEALRSNNTFGAIVISYDNGHIFMAKLLETERERLFFDGPPESDMLVLDIRPFGPSPVSEYSFYDAQLRLLSRREDARRPEYLDSERFWYQAAMQADGVIETDPQIIHSRETVSMVMARKSLDGHAVVALGIRLDQLSELLAGERPTPGSRLVLFQPDYHILAAAQGLIAHNDGRLALRSLDDLAPVIRLGMEKFQQGLRTTELRLADGADSTGVRIQAEGRDWLLVLEELDDDPDRIGDFMVLAIPRDEMHVTAGRFLRYAMLGVGVLLLLLMPVAWLVARHVSTPLRVMTERTRNLMEMRDGGKKTPLSLVPEINDLMRNVEFMRENQRKILSIIGMIGGDRDFEALPGRVLREIMNITEADGGVLVIMSESKTALEKGWFCWDGGEIQKAVCPPDSEIPQNTYAMARALNEGCAIVDHVTRDDPRSALTAVTAGFAGYPGVERMDVVGLPLRGHMGENLGGLSLLKRVQEPYPGLSPEQLAFMETIAAAAAVVLETQTLIKSQQDLRDALIRILAGAIDTKSPYTGGHCARVPAIFQMLLEAAHETEDGPLKDFRLDDASREEARLAAWLHDCGKVTTPEYVMDKATKLETLYDRIHEIRTRFEVLKRDAENASLKARLEGADPAEEQRKLVRALAELDDDFAFVAACNLGGEHMDDAAQARLAVIGKRAWVRTLDKRLGVSRDELTRMGNAAVPDAPVRETLLMDNPEHIIPRGEKDMLPADNSWGFKLDVPDVLYNRGELYNLSIRRGTLTTEERYKINDHITRTIIMLEELPLPEHLRGVPEIAGAHHETMDGRGYPRRLQREDMSWGARMMAIADIFEALTACDRPYKNSKTLSEALEIMESFKKNNHIDPYLYELFQAADIPERYAVEYLKAEQNDLRRSA